MQKYGIEGNQCFTPPNIGTDGSDIRNIEKNAFNKMRNINARLSSVE